MPLEVKVSTRCTVVKLFTGLVCEMILSFLYYWYYYSYCRRFRIYRIDADTHSFGRLLLGVFCLYFQKYLSLVNPCVKVRHAQGIHNVEGEKDHDAYLSSDFFDAHLSPLGWKQVIAG
jgi:hypothetical protein